MKRIVASLAVAMAVCAASAATTLFDFESEDEIKAAPRGKGNFWLMLDWDFPANVRSTADSPHPANPRLDLWLRIVGRLFLCTPRAVKMIDGSDSKYINWAVYPDGTTYYLNTDCVKSRTIYIDGKPMPLAPKEMKRIGGVDR